MIWKAIKEIQNMSFLKNSMKSTMKKRSEEEFHTAAVKHPELCEAKSGILPSKSEEMGYKGTE